MSIGSLFEPETVGELLLREACLLSERVEALAEGSALGLAGLPVFASGL